MRTLLRFGRTRDTDGRWVIGRHMMLLPRVPARAACRVSCAPVTESLWTRLRWRLGRTLLRVFGRPVSCATCGRQIFYGVAFVSRGRVRLLGAADDDVRVAFATRDRLELHHVDLDRCPTADRPWVT